ncbi:MAG TPA: A24 family peptidase [Methylibium sp.]
MYRTTIMLLATLLLAAVATDLRWRRIPNTLVLAGIAAAWILNAAASHSGSAALAGSAWWSSLAGLGLGLVLLLPLYLLGACGAGDVKLMAMVGAFVGARVVPAVVLDTMLAGGLLSLAYMLARGVAAQTLSNVRFLLADWILRLTGGQATRLAPLQTTAARLPYAVAIAAGTAAALIWPLAGSMR